MMLLKFIIIIIMISTSSSQRSSTIQSPHGTIYGFNHLDPNSYIYQNKFRSFATGPSSFLTNALFYGHEIRFGSTMHRIDTFIEWDEQKEQQWRATIKPHYFDNSIPQTDDSLSAALVDGKKRRRQRAL
jgi:hypothetical protein